MKIGIITQPLCSNYGGILQNFALQQQLIHLGHEPITIDLVTHLNKSKCAYVVEAFKTVLHCIKRGKSIKLLKYEQKRPILFDSFVSRYLKITESVSSYSNSILEKYDIECIVVGSDQVWRPVYNVYPLDMYLNFCQKNKIPKISYAASFGVDQWEYSPELTGQCQDLIKLFDSVSVREFSGIRLCNEYLKRDAVRVLDPTLLLDKKIYMELCGNVPVCNEKYIAIYAFGLPAKTCKLINSFALSNNLKVISFTSDTDHTLSVEEWIARFRDASYVITDSFHGTVFSIIFNKNFISVANKSRGAARFLSLLNDMGLNNRLVYAENFSLKILSESINWVVVNEKKRDLIAYSISFLKDNIK